MEKNPTISKMETTEITMAQQDKQKQLLIEVMNEDAKDGLYKTTQTAVEWLWNELVDKGYFKRLPISEIKQAKQMEETQRTEDYKLGYRHGIGDTSLSNMTINKINENK